jgi:hypothetical protein
LRSYFYLPFTKTIIMQKQLAALIIPSVLLLFSAGTAHSQAGKKPAAKAPASTNGPRAKRQTQYPHYLGR